VNRGAARARRLALHTWFVDDLDERVEGIRALGSEPASRETYENGVRKVIYRDPDGSEIGFAGAPLERAEHPDRGYLCVRRGLTHDRVTACYSPERQAQ